MEIDLHTLLAGNNTAILWANRRIQRLSDTQRYEENASYFGLSGSKARKFSIAMIAKIPLPLSQHIARTFRP